MSYEIIKMTTPLGQVPPKSIFCNLQDKHYYIKTAEKTTFQCTCMELETGVICFVNNEMEVKVCHGTKIIIPEEK